MPTKYRNLPAPTYPYALPFRPVATSVKRYFVRTETPAGPKDVPTDEATIRELVEAGCSWFYGYTRPNYPPISVHIVAKTIDRARADRLASFNWRMYP